MRFKKAIYLIIVICLSACEEGRETNNTSHYKLNLPGTDYTWDFERHFNYFASEVSAKQYQSGILVSPQIFDGNFWAIDRSKAQLVKFDEELKSVVRLGKKGNGYVDENMNFHHFFMRPPYYYIFDDKMVVKRYSIEGDSLVDYRYQTGFNTAMAQIGDNQFIIAPESDSIPDSFYFSIFNFYEDTYNALPDINSILDIPIDTEIAYILYDGQLVSGNQYAVYFFFKYGAFIVFENGQLKQVYKTIDKSPAPLPAYLEQNGATSLSTKPEKRLYLDAQIVEDKLFLLNQISRNTHKCIDVYSLQTGEYDGSFKLDQLGDSQLPVSFAIDKNQIVVIYEDMMVKRFKYVKKP